LTLVVLRLIVTLGALCAGPEGGLLTPGLTIGALLGTMAGVLWNHLWPAVPLGAFAIVGGVAFLASSMKMPLTAILLMLEFTRVGHDFLIPACLAVAGSISVSHLFAERHRIARETGLLSKQTEERGSPAEVPGPSEDGVSA
jgi:H+/Cl- antiporter ClcA